MEMSELTALLTRDGLALLDAVGTIESTAEVARTVSRLRAAGHSPTSSRPSSGRRICG
ncbi:hypothetical protein GCM10025863_17620 [Microbacterium suwonense]|uniref:Uncharacterized protein n=1 Tax=Microbacterium suwonense TaxID=683047 RepID=A0ABN6X2Y0_9MICO|nr:hypothetical protein GCM10025863_17620 [Microbacterium suwonense]